MYYKTCAAFYLKKSIQNGKEKNLSEETKHSRETD